MACETERNPLGVFKCQLCALTAPYSYKGQQPPDCQSVVLLEESYVTRDPFTPDRGRFLILGSRCSVCSRLVCVGPVQLACALPSLGSRPFQSSSRALPEEGVRFLERLLCARPCAWDVCCQQRVLQSCPSLVRQSSAAPIL
ncbi:cysteine-rich DPF motif domain-containing protein 1 isoform X1 [Muntiacus reevesi]|uniref:cysteine-rich DPF motif domain-containing protein 1 isoform X1 n=1 Tax=Muntiacus reevesi TaxID=9886 RepID=UPI003306D6CC